MDALQVEVQWDAEAMVWIGCSDDVPGLCVQADSVDEIIALIEHFTPVLLLANNVRLDSDHVPIQTSLTKQSTVAVRDGVAVC